VTLARRAFDAWNRFWFEPGPPEVLGICRILFYGTALLWLGSHDYSAWGGYSSVFWMPIWLFERFHLPALSVPAIAAMQAIWKLALFFAAIGLFTRAAMIVVFVFGTYLMGLPHNFGQTQHFDTLVVFVCAVLAISRAGDAWSVDAWRASLRAPSRQRLPDHWEYTWPIRFVWVAMAMIFGAAGFAKLRASGLDWVFSDNLGLLLQRQQYHVSDGEPWTNWGLWVSRHRWASQALAACSIVVETLFPLTIFSRHARRILVPGGLLFLVGIRALMGPTFEQFMLCYIFWIPWRRILSRVGALADTPVLAAAHAVAGSPPAATPGAAPADADFVAGH
jgi:hypothetical protein